jgi:hypothetical protein
MNLLKNTLQYLIETFESSQMKYLKSFVESGETFMISDKAIIEKYNELFDTLEENNLLYNDLFSIHKVLPINSENGIVFLIKLREIYAKDVTNGIVLVKVPKNDVDDVDSLSYEYYIGKSLNNLRKMNKTPVFSLVYGKTLCGVDPNIAKICDPEHPQSVHLFYEYVRNVNTQRTTSLDSYIATLKTLSQQEALVIERNIINIMIMIMYSLQIAHDTTGFTHYDLHLGNILVVELDTPEKVVINYNGEEMVIVTKVIPYIIDYGRCYINDSAAIPDEDGKFRETQPDYVEDFHTISSFQDFLFDIDGYMEKNPRELEKIDEQIAIFVHEYIHKHKVYRESSSGKLYYIKNDKRIYDIYSDTLTTERMKSLIIDNVFNKHTLSNEKHWRKETDINGNSSIKINRSNLGIKSNKPNTKYDFYKLTKYVIDKVLNNTQLNYENNTQLNYEDAWNELDAQLDIEYPFRHLKYFSLPCDYHITDYVTRRIDPGVWGFWLKNAADLGKLFYSWIKDDIYITPDLHVRYIHSGGRVNLPNKLSKKIEKKSISLSKKGTFYKGRTRTRVQTVMDNSIEVVPLRKMTQEEFDSRKRTQQYEEEYFTLDTVDTESYINTVETDIVRTIKEKHRLYGKPEKLFIDRPIMGPIRKSDYYKKNQNS